MSDTFTMKRGDTLPVLSVTLKKKTGSSTASPIDLSDVSSVSLFFRRGDTLLTRVGVIDAVPESGIVTYTFADADWLTGEFSTGKYSVEFQLTYTFGAKYTAPTVGYATFIVTEDLDT